MNVTITVHTGRGRYEIALDGNETNGEAWGADKSHVDRLLDAAVWQIKRAYGGDAPTKEVDA